MRPLLTIAIPTYNRDIKLAESLKRVIELSTGKNIEILVSDNASTDDTSKICMTFMKDNPNVFYYRNLKNLGFDGNFLKCMERAKGKYVWLLSDDDILLPGAIESVIFALEKDPICVHLNFSNLQSEKPITYSRPRYVREGIVEYEDRNLFLKKIGIYCTFISSLIFNTDLVKDIPNKEIYFGTNILQSHVLFELMKNEGLYLVNTYTCIAARSNTSVSYDVLKTWIKNFSELMLSTGTECKFKSEVLDEILNKELRDTIYGFVLDFRLTCQNEREWDRMCIEPYIKKYKGLEKKYRIAVECPHWYLRVLQIKLKLQRKLYCRVRRYKREL